MAKKKDLQKVLHKLDMYYSSGQSANVDSMLLLISKWSYAHRQGNGELTEHEQNQRICSAWAKLRDFEPGGI